MDKRKKTKTEQIKKTMYIEKELVKKIKLKAVMEESTESNTLNKILRQYFTSNGN